MGTWLIWGEGVIPVWGGGDPATCARVLPTGWKTWECGLSRVSDGMRMYIMQDKWLLIRVHFYASSMVAHEQDYFCEVDGCACARMSNARSMVANAQICPCWSNGDCAAVSMRLRMRRCIHARTMVAHAQVYPREVGGCACASLFMCVHAMSMVVHAQMYAS